MLIGLSSQLGCELSESCILGSFIFVFPVTSIVPATNRYLNTCLGDRRMMCSLSKKLGMRGTISLPFPKFSGLDNDFIAIISSSARNMSHDPITFG